VSRINFIKGELKGRLGEIVGSSWKGKAYTKTYTQPKNPNTPAQQEIRHLFQTLAHIGTGIRVPLEEYTRPLPKKMTAYNHLIQLNKPMFGKQGHKWDPLELVIMSGDLKSLPITTAVFDVTAFTATVTWDGTTGADDDKAFVVIYNDESKHIVYATEIDRSVGTVVIDASKFKDVSSYNEIYAYLTFYRVADGTGIGAGMNSGTSVLKMTKS
jgi:hypothetical protein